MSLDIILKHDDFQDPHEKCIERWGACSSGGARAEHAGRKQRGCGSAKSAKGAVLLFHGFTGSPFELQKYANFLYKNGYDVYAECLPGHGDNFAGIYTVKYQDWLEHAYKNFKQLKAQYENVYAAGLCLGAVLALAAAEKYPDEVSGVISLSTTLFLDGWRLPKFMFLLYIAFSTVFRFYYFYPECEPHGIKNEKTRAVVKKLLVKGETGMNDFPLTGIYELFKLSKYVRKRLKAITAPVLLVHSKEDDLTSIKSAEIVYKNISSADKDMIILYDSYHMILYDNEREFVFNKTLEFMEKRLKKACEKETSKCMQMQF